jgi:hypothetical protein
MKRIQIRYALQDAFDNETLLDIRRKRDDFNWCGFVVGLSEEWILLNVLDTNTMQMNGYSAILLKHIEKVREEKDAPSVALRLRGISPAQQPDILLIDLPGLLSSADAHFPLVTIHIEDKDPDVCYIGRVLRTSRRKVTLRRIDRRAIWLESKKYEFGDITRVDFGDGYARALHEVEQLRRQEKS